MVRGAAMSTPRLGENASDQTLGRKPEARRERVASPRAIATLSRLLSLIAERANDNDGRQERKTSYARTEPERNHYIVIVDPGFTF